MGGFTMHSIASASLMDMTVNPPLPADEGDIRVVSSTGDDPSPPDNSDVKGLVGLIPNYAATRIMIMAAPDARVGSQYRLNVCATARDCDGRKATMCDCVMVVVAEC